MKSVMVAVLAVLAYAGACDAGSSAPFDEKDPGSIHAFAERLLVHRDPAAIAANRNRIFLALDNLRLLPVYGDLTNRVRYAEAGDAGDPEAGAVCRPDGGDWFNCMCESAQALSRLESFEGRKIR